MTKKVKMRLAEALLRAANAAHNADLVCPFHAMRVACPSGSVDYFVCRELVGLLFPGGAAELSRLCRTKSQDPSKVVLLLAVVAGALLRDSLAAPSSVDSVVRKWL